MLAGVWTDEVARCVESARRKLDIVGIRKGARSRTHELDASLCSAGRAPGLDVVCRASVPSLAAKGTGGPRFAKHGNGLHASRFEAVGLVEGNRRGCGANAAGAVSIGIGHYAPRCRQGQPKEWEEADKCLCRMHCRCREC